MKVNNRIFEFKTQNGIALENARLKSLLFNKKILLRLKKLDSIKV
jgi:histidinol phosphatase-like PHP family hydrolase